MYSLDPIPFIHIECECGSNLYHISAESHYGTAFKGVAQLHAKQEGCQFAVVKNTRDGCVLCPFCGITFQLANDIVLRNFNVQTGN